MSRALSLLTAALIAAGATAEARQVDPMHRLALIDRYAAACNALSAAECEIGQPVSDQDARRLACLFDELEERAGEGTAEAHVAWAEGFAAAGQPPATGFPASIGQQQILVAAMIACRGNQNT